MTQIENNTDLITTLIATDNHTILTVSREIAAEFNFKFNQDGAALIPQQDGLYEYRNDIGNPWRMMEAAAYAELKDALPHIPDKILHEMATNAVGTFFGDEYRYKAWADAIQSVLPDEEESDDGPR